MTFDDFLKGRRGCGNAQDVRRTVALRLERSDVVGREVFDLAVNKGEPTGELMDGVVCTSGIKVDKNDTGTGATASPFQKQKLHSGHRPTRRQEGIDRPVNRLVVAVIVANHRVAGSDCRGSCGSPTDQLST